VAKEDLDEAAHLAAIVRSPPFPYIAKIWMQHQLMESCGGADVRLCGERGLGAADRIKDEFFATLSHELRTPLNAILGYSRMLHSGMLTADKHAHALRTVERNATSLTQIVEDILDVSRIISGKIRLNVQPVDLPVVMSTAVETRRNSQRRDAPRCGTVMRQPG
jgi:signal transduction histidine kinase